MDLTADGRRSPVAKAMGDKWTPTRADRWGGISPQSLRRQERQSVQLPMVENMTRLTLSVQESQGQNQESHVALMAVATGLKAAVDILCQKANGGKGAGSAGVSPAPSRRVPPGRRRSQMRRSQAGRGQHATDRADSHPSKR